MNRGGDEQMRDRCAAAITTVRASSGQVKKKKKKSKTRLKLPVKEGSIPAGLELYFPLCYLAS